MQTEEGRKDKEKGKNRAKSARPSMAKLPGYKNTKPDEASFRESIVNKEKGRSPDL